MHPRSVRAAAVLCLGLSPLACRTASSTNPLPSLLGRDIVDLDGAPRPVAAGDGRVGTLLFFVTTDCPIANGYAPEINAIAAHYAEHDVHSFLVQVDPDTSRGAAREHALAYGTRIPVVLDPEHELVELAGATITPEAALFDADGALVYRGRIDDWYAELGRKRRAPTRHDLREALECVIAGRPIEVPRVPAVGCFIPETR